MSNTKSITVDILDKKLQLSCPEGEESGLYRSARYLNDKLKALQESNRTLDKERITIIAALNITHELFKLQNDIAQDRKSLSSQHTNLIHHIDEALQAIQS